jgi:hypothetical protein
MFNVLGEAIEKPFCLDIDVTDKTPVDDIPESYYKNAKNEWKAQNTEKQAIEKGLVDLSINQLSEQFLMNEIHRTTSSHDDHVVNVAFHAALSAYNKPLNLALKAESGSGKSYSTTQTVLLMPKEDVLYIASQSPKVISHENGVPKTLDGEILTDDKAPVEPSEEACADHMEFLAEKKRYKEAMKEWKKKLDNCIYEVDLRNKVVVFLESINTETFKMLKSTMSYDNEENGWVDHKYVDDKGKVHTTRLVGAPCLIFNSLDNEYISEFATRCLTATPSTTKDKINSAMEISNRKSSFPWEYSVENFNRRLIQEYIRKIRDIIQKGKISVVNPFTDVYKVFSIEQTRSMRDFNKYLELMAPYAMFKLFQRPVIIVAGHRFLVPTVQDALEAKAAFDAIIQTTQTGTEQRIISFYYEIVAKHPNGAEAEFLTDEFNKGRKKPYASRTIRDWLNRLVNIEWVDEREGCHENSKGYIDKRFKLYVPLRKAESTAVLETTVDLKAVLEKSFKSWLKTIAEIKSFSPPIIIPKIDGTAIEISLEEMESIVLGLELPKFSGGSEEDISATVSKSEKNVTCENKLESTAIIQNAVVPETLQLVDGKTYSQIQYKLKIKHIKSIEHCKKCWDCEALLSEWQIEKFANNVSEGFAYNCNSCLKEHTIPAYKAQGANIDLELPTSTEEVS